MIKSGLHANSNNYNVENDFSQIELTIDDIVSKVFIEEDKYANLKGMIKALERITSEANTNISNHSKQKASQEVLASAEQLKQTLSQLKTTIDSQT
jgi:hypothetical protein